MAGSLEPNLRYYEQRTAHGSSLSPAIHASVLAVRATSIPPACVAHRRTHDLDDLTALPLRACISPPWRHMAGTGLRICGAPPALGALHVDPVLPPSWSAFELRVRSMEAGSAFERNEPTLHLG